MKPGGVVSVAVALRRTKSGDRYTVWVKDVDHPLGCSYQPAGKRRSRRRDDG